jgi:transcriptional regulator with XRE-family HTH domain
VAVTSGELIRAARLRAGLTQEQLGERLMLPASSIARWETDRVEPGLSTVRRVLRKCGFDLSMELIPFELDPVREARIEQLQRQTPQQRLQGLVERTRGE